MRRALIVTVALAMLGAPGARADEPPEPPVFANVEKFRTAGGVEVYLFASRGWSALADANVCIAAVRRRVANGIRTVTAETGCSDTDRLTTDWMAGHASLRIPVVTHLYIQRQRRVDGTWTSFREAWPRGRYRSRVVLAWQGGERRLEPGLGGACVPMVVFYACVPLPLVYPAVYATHDATVDGTIVLRGLRARIALDDRPGHLSFRLPA